MSATRSINAALLDEEGATSTAPTVTLSWRTIEAFVAEAKNKFSDAAALKSCSTYEEKQVLFSASGDAHPGELLAVMGPSGAGKTTLLDILAGRPALGERGRWSGAIMHNGREPPSAWKRDAAYSMQKDIFFEKLSVYDHLRCTAACRLPASWSRKAKAAELDRIVKLLRLEKCLHTVVGSKTVRGLSGGELKRLNVATELLARPRLLFMDEPFTGLDSSLALATLGTLREVAKDAQVAIILTVHQPSSAMWSAFDQLLLMAPGGRVAYHGPKEDAIAHFANLDLPLPELWSPADHFIEIVSGEEPSDDTRRKFVADAWAARPPLPPPPIGVVLPKRPIAPLHIAIPALLRRQMKQVVRVYLRPIEWLLVGLLAAVFGMLWWQIGIHRDEPKRQADYVSLIFFFVAQWSWAPLFQVIGNFPSERDVLTRERASESYSVTSWYLSKLCAELPLSWLLPAGFFAVTYPLSAMPLTQCPTLFGIVLLNVEVAASLGALIGASFFDRDEATTVAIVYMVFVMCAGGYFINLDVAPKWVGYCRYVSFWYYSMGLFVAYALPTDTDRSAFVTNHTLAKYSFSPWSWEGHPERDVAVLIGFALLHRVSAFFVLLNSKKLEFS